MFMKSISEISFSGKKVLIRTDFNVPINELGKIRDNSRIVASLPTIKHVLSTGGSCILASHMGRPKGKNEELSLARLIPELNRLIDADVIFLADCIGPHTKEVCLNLTPGKVVLLENLRFYKEEILADFNFAKELASLADVYINDAYGTTHREHASTVTIAQFFNEKCAGMLLIKEINSLKKLMDNPKKPVTAIIGGAKVSSKISVIINILDFVDNLIIGGGMAYTFVKHNGGRIGDSIFEKDRLKDCSNILLHANKKNVKLFLPDDTVASDQFSEKSIKKTVDINEVPDGWQGLDIGPRTIEKFERVIENSKTVLWNGPMGVFEMSSYEKGTSSIAKSVAQATINGAFSLVGGGDSVAAIKKFNLENDVSFISTGGGAMLESLEGKALPGIKALM